MDATAVYFFIVFSGMTLGAFTKLGRPDKAYLPPLIIGLCGIGGVCTATISIYAGLLFTAFVVFGILLGLGERHFFKEDLLQ